MTLKIILMFFIARCKFIDLQFRQHEYFKAALLVTKIYWLTYESYWSQDAQDLVHAGLLSPLLQEQ